MDKLKIILVEDDKDDRLFFANALNSLDMNTELNQMKNGLECLEFLDNNPSYKPHLIFLDLNMPVMNGFECLEEIRKDKNHEETIIAIYSTSSHERDIEKTFVKGANIYITKPTDLEGLRKSLKQVIKTNWTYHMSGFNREVFLLKV